MKIITVNQLIPNCKLPTAAHPNQTLQDLRGKTVVLYFYPKDNTPGCTQEGKDFTLLFDQFTQANAVILGVSRDSATSHEKFSKKYCFPFELISDTDSQLCKLFDVLGPKNMFGKIATMIQRSTFVIDKNGILRHEWRGLKVNGHAQQVLEIIKSL